MGARHGGSYGHRARKIEADHYRLSWTVDRYYASSRLRHPTRFRRDTDRDGAERFARRWGLSLDPSPPEPAGSREGER